jgi:hypothetical protein
VRCGKEKTNLNLNLLKGKEAENTQKHIASELIIYIYVH